MKSLLWIVSITSLLLAGCKSGTDQQALVQGEIIGLDNNTLYLVATDEFLDRVDTLFTVQGKFSQTLPVDTLVHATLLLKDSIEYPVFLDKGQTISIYADIRSVSAPIRIEGNPLNKEYSKFRNSLYVTDTLSKENILEKTEEFIRTHPSSRVSAYLLDKYYLQAMDPDYGKIRELIAGMAGDLKDLPFIQQANDVAEQQEKTVAGKTAPAFNLKNPEAKSILRTSFRDKYLVLHFWASWCDSCSQSLPQLKEIYNTYKKQDKFSLLSISLDLNHTDWEEAIEKDTLDWEQVSDLSGWNGSVVRQYGILSLPSYTLIGPDGRILDQKMTLDSLSVKLREVFETKK
ncbi:MAG: AhpC/TSA family protein [Bacteroides sp.]|nr:AhpC/TSA family protein [Bacteroides sp.]